MGTTDFHIMKLLQIVLKRQITLLIYVPLFYSSWFRVRNNLLEPISRSSRIHLSNGILIVDSLKVGVQTPIEMIKGIENINFATK